MALHPPLSPLTHHWDNVTAPHGRPKVRSRLHFCHAQEGGTRSPQRACGGIGGGIYILSLYILYFQTIYNLRPFFSISGLETV
jgi:hypothetical protein